MPVPETASNPLVGKTFDCVFGPFTPRLTFQTPRRLRVQAVINGESMDDVVDVDVKTVRPDVLLVNWTESNGNFIVQVQDHRKMVVHNYARLADGQQFCAEGVIEAVPA